MTETGMNVERFQARTMKEALEQVKRSLGEDAVVLSTRTVRSKGLLGQRMFEVSALPWDPARRELIGEGTKGTKRASLTKAGPVSPLASTNPLSHLSHVQSAEPTLTLDDLDRAVEPLRQEVRSLKAQLRGSTDPLRRDLRKTIEELRATVAMVHETPQCAASELRDQLVDSGVGPVLAAAVVEEARSRLGDEPLHETEERAILTALVEQVIGRRLEVRPELPHVDGPCRVVALVGPTGVGKTTTVAKLASLAALVERRNVALITMDTYRVGGVEQLRRFAALIGVSFSLASDGESLRAALKEHRDADLVLIDTAGRSPRQRGTLDALSGAFTQAGELVQVHLVLAAAARQRELEATLRHYETLAPECLIFTKTDEAWGGGAVLEACVRSHLPLSFVCNGQRVPEDITPANAAWLAAFVLGQEEN